MNVGEVHLDLLRKMQKQGLLLEAAADINKNCAIYRKDNRKGILVIAGPNTRILGQPIQELVKSLLGN